MIRRRQKRGRKPTKRMDLSDMRSLFRDRRMWCALATVYAPTGGTHWEIVPGVDGAPFDVIVEVETQPDQVTMSARLRAGMWEVPAIGDEVIVAIPNGAIEFQPTIIAVLSSGSVPAVQGPQPGRILIAKPEVLIHDGTGGAVELALKSDVERLETAIAGATIAGGDGGATLKATISAGLATSLHGVSGTDVWPVGTTVLKAK